MESHDNLTKLNSCKFISNFEEFNTWEPTKSTYNVSLIVPKPSLLNIRNHRMKMHWKLSSNKRCEAWSITKRRHDPMITYLRNSLHGDRHEVSDIKQCHQHLILQKVKFWIYQDVNIIKILWSITMLNR